MSRTSQTKKKEPRKIFPLLLSPSERVELERRAAEAGMKLSEYLRRAGLKRKRRARVPDINRQTYIELGRIGNNLNQIAKACHLNPSVGGCHLDPNLLQSLCDQLDQVRLELLGVDPYSEEEEDDWQTD